MKKTVAIFFLTLLISCDKENQEISRRDVMEKYKKDAITHGDDYAYGSCLEYDDNNVSYLDKLSLSIIMNHKHKNLRSYYQVYRNMVELHNNNKYKAEYLKNLDSVNRNYAMHYLKEGARKNDIDCQATLEKIYRHGYGIKNDLKKSDSLYSILEMHPSIGRFYRDNKNDKSRIDRID